MKKKSSLWVLSPLFFIFISCTTESQIEKQFAYAQELVIKKKYKEAIDAYSKIAKLRKFKDLSEKSMMNMASVHYFYLKDNENAFHILDGLVQRSSDITRIIKALRMKAYIYHYSIKDFEKALMEYQKVLDFDLTHREKSEVLFEIAECYFLLNQYDQARVEFLKSSELTQDILLKERISYEVATSYFLESQYEKAEATYKDHQRLFSKGKYDLQVSLNLAKSLESQEKLKEAILIYKEILKDNPKQQIAVLKLKKVEERYKIKGLK
ncbi:MAG: tetratricopeptide repeat protein [Deltaproteobacteria bacterium]|nr:tetratricopeptide repeat protein [Deltaproteobacteria bacterium]